MNIKDIIPKLPLRVKLNNKFTLEESFDTNTILLIKSASIDDWGGDGEKCYKVHVTALADDMKYNRSIAIADWFDDNHNPTLTYFDVTKKILDKDGNLNDIIYVMENDDCFDLVEENKNTSNIERAIYELNELSDELKLRVNNLNQLESSDRIKGKIEGVNLAIESIGRQLKLLNEKL